MRQRFTTLGFSTVLLSGLLLPASFGQEAKPEVGLEATANGAPMPEKTQRLILVVEAPGDKLKDDVEEMFGRAIKNTVGCKAKSISVQPITKLVHDSIKRFTEAGAGPDVIYSGTGEVQQLTADLPDGLAKEAGTSRWEVRVEPFTTVNRIKLNYDEGKSPKDSPTLSEFTAKPRKDSKEPFRFYAPGLYILSLDKPELPSSYQLETQSEGAKEPVWGDKRPWPQTGRFYFVQMEDFSGDQSRLFSTLKDAKIMGNAAQTVSTPKAVSITSINYTIQPVIEGGTVDATRYQIVEAKPEGIYPKRVWLHFPLTQKRQQELLGEWNAAGKTREKRKELLAKIKSEAVKADVEAKVPANGDARWYELPARTNAAPELPPIPVREGDFWRVFSVVPGFLREAPGGDQEPIYGIKAYEFEGNEENFLLEISQGRRVVGSTYPNWINALRARGAQKP